MGLDIRAYSNLRQVPGSPQLPCRDEDHITAYAYHVFPLSFRGIPITRVYGDLLIGPCYQTTDLTETHSFRAGSYLGYGRWRDALAEAYNPERKPNALFGELIYFADNEGCIGPDAAKELLVHFRSHEPPPETLSSLWDDWTRAFELASNRGLVEFT